MYFVDTGFIIALEDADDQHHTQVIDFWKRLSENPKRLVTTTYVFDEIVTFLNNRLGFDKAEYVGKKLRESNFIEIVYISEEHFNKGWEKFLKYKDKKFSFTDCLSFLIMEERGIFESLTFDHHFEQVGYKMYPTSI